MSTPAIHDSSNVPVHTEEQDAEIIRRIADRRMNGTGLRAP